MLFYFALLITLVQLCAAKPVSRRWNDLTEKHAWDEIPRGWVYESPAPANLSFNMHIGLKQDKIVDLIASLMETSDPGHSRYVIFTPYASIILMNLVRYGKHLTKAEADALVAPHPDSREAVESWFGYHGVKPEDIIHSSGGGDWITLRVTVAQAERMLGTKYNVYHHPASSERVVRTMSYSLPRDLHSHVEVVVPTTYFGTLRSMRSTHIVQSDFTDIKDISDEQSSPSAIPPTSCNTVITPSCLRILYNTNNYVPAATNVNKLGVAGYLNEYANRADLQVRFSISVITPISS